MFFRTRTLLGPIEMVVFRRVNLQRITSFVLLVGYCASHVPLPVSSLADKSSALPFPCQHHSCGCRTAEQCWRQCCCFTQAQKIAWANAHQVTPPKLVATSDESPRRACCDAKAKAKAKEKEKGKQTPADDAKATTYVVMIQSQQCQGKHTVWKFTSWVTLPTPRASWQTNSRVDVVTEFSPPAVRRSYPPPVPPPRSCRSIG